MANLKVFISSTCYDLQSIRAQLRAVLSDIGYEPVMSDHSDVIFDPRIHTHTSCLREVENCDVLVLVIGSRFGGTTIPKAMELIDMDRLTDISRADRFAEDKTKISITQAEVLQAIQASIPVFAFVDTGVMRDHLTYEKNRNKSIIGQIEFSSIDKSETAPYIFEFINFLRLRNENNSIFEFTRFEDIESQLKKQWAGLFQRLLHEQKAKAFEGRRIDFLSSQIADLKAAVLGSISSGELKETAKGAIRFRYLIDFLSSLAEAYKPTESPDLLRSDLDWDSLMKALGIVEFRSMQRGAISMSSMVLIREDGTHYRVRQPTRVLPRLIREWSDFRGLGNEAKTAIITAVSDSREGRQPLLVRHVNEPFVEGESSITYDDVDSERDSTKAPRILLTAEKFIEESIKNFIVSKAKYRGFSIVIDASAGALSLFVKKDLSDINRSFNFSYVIPESGSLAGVIDTLQSSIETAFDEFLKESI